MFTKDILRKKLDEIHLSLCSNYKDTTDIGVLSGISGIALFQFYYAKYTKQESAANIGTEIIYEVIEKINKGYDYPTFCAGIAGAAWVIEHLNENNFIEIDSDELLQDLDEYLTYSIEEITGENFYDFLHGILGIGFYYLKRFKNTKSNELRTQYKNILLNIVERLSVTSQEIGNTAKWESYLRVEEKQKGYNLGLAHGMSSIINFLSRLIRCDDFNMVAKSVLEKTVNFIISCKYNENSKIACFPDWITSENVKSESIRLGWCYGDLGTGLSLWKAGSALKNDEICKRAIAVIKHSCKRKHIKETNIQDAGLCHGSYGVMHIYNYMFKQTGETIFKKAADYWMQKSLEMAIHQKGYAGYMKWQGGENEGWKNEVSLLGGIAGIGLAIISYLAPFKTNWSECLLID